MVKLKFVAIAASSPSQPAARPGRSTPNTLARPCPLKASACDTSRPRARIAGSSGVVGAARGPNARRSVRRAHRVPSGNGATHSRARRTMEPNADNSSSRFIFATRNGRTAIRLRRTTSHIRCGAVSRRSSRRAPHTSRITSKARRPITRGKVKPKTSV